ncbi:hypothetical protein KKE60_06070 [Patescibacteria group bacterium]|nr:hypothetical protein [Patescibacteria group bacterium]
MSDIYVEVRINNNAITVRRETSLGESLSSNLAEVLRLVFLGLGYAQKLNIASKEEFGGGSTTSPYSGSTTSPYTG